MTGPDALRYGRAMKIVAVAAVCWVVGAGCSVVEDGEVGDGRDDAFLTGGKVDGLGVGEGSQEALAILEVANTLSVEALDASEAVGLDGRAARAIGARRDGPDEIPGTDDDLPFEFLWELDAVPYVGPVAIGKILTYAEANGYMVPPVVDIRIVGAVIGVGVAEGIEWDSFSAIDEQLIEDVLEALFGPSPYLSIIALLATPAVQAMSAPDAFGTATVDGSQQITLATVGNNSENTFQPIWPGSPGWSGVEFDDDIRIAVSLTDEDVFFEHDDIGIVELNAVDIRNAWRSSQVFAVDVSDQTDEQLLFVRISVSEP